MTVVGHRTKHLQNNINAWHRLFNLAKLQLINNPSHTCHHHAEITQSHTFAALLRLSTTTHTILTFNKTEISSNNSEKLSLLANKHLWTFLLHSSYASSQMNSRALGISPDFISEKNRNVHLQVCSHLIHLTPKSLFLRPKT